MADTNANVRFLKGSQANLDNIKSIEEGSFYLTTDTERLYFANTSVSVTSGNVANELLCINRSVRYINGDALPTAEQYTLKTGDMFYIAGLNAFVVYNDSNTFVQVNPDTFLKSATGTAMSVSTSGDSAIISMAVSDTKNGTQGLHTASGNFTLKPGNNVTINTNSATREITIGSSYTNSTYNLKTASTTAINNALVKLVGTNPASTATITITSDGKAVNITSDDDGNISITGKEQIQTLSQTFSATGGFQIGAVLGSGDSVASQAVYPSITYGKNEDKSAIFANGVATLNVYSTTEVDEKVQNILRSADALVFQGVVSNQSEANTKLNDSDRKAGDTYKVGANSVTATGENSTNVTAEKGDLLIAVKSGNNIYWEVVPSGDEKIVTFSNFSNSGNNTITIGTKYPTDISDVDSASLTINGSTSVTNSNNLIVVTPSVSNKNKTLAISHGKPAINSGSALNFTSISSTQAASATKEIKTITAISYDEAGHITTATGETIKVVDTHGSLSLEDIYVSTTASDNVTIGQYGLGLIFDDSSQSKYFGIRSSTLKIAVAPNSGTAALAAGLDINLTWGSFDD